MAPYEGNQGHYTPDQYKEVLLSFYTDRILPETLSITIRLREKYNRQKNFMTDEEAVEWACNRLPFCQVTTAKKSVLESPSSTIVRRVEDVKIVLLTENLIPRGFCGFVDPNNSECLPYDPRAVEELKLYFKSLESSKNRTDYAFTGGRYGCAVRLRNQCSPLDGKYKDMLKHCSKLVVGEIVHIVQNLLVEKVISYEGPGGNVIVPYSRRTDPFEIEAKKLLLAARDKMKNEPRSTSTLEEAIASTSIDSEEKLVQVFESLLLSPLCGRPEDKNGNTDLSRCILLSKVIGLIKFHFGLDLYKTAFGYTKIRDLIESPYLNKVAELAYRRESNDLVVFPTLRLLKEGPSQPLLLSLHAWSDKKGSKQIEFNGSGRYRHPCMNFPPTLMHPVHHKPIAVPPVTPALTDMQVAEHVLMSMNVTPEQLLSVLKDFSPRKEERLLTLPTADESSSCKGSHEDEFFDRSIIGFLDSL